MMVLPITPEGQTEPLQYSTVTGDRVELWIEDERRAFYIHTSYAGVKVLSDFRSGKKVPYVDLSDGTPQEALNRVTYRFKRGHILSVMNAAPQLNLL